MTTAHATTIGTKTQMADTIFDAVFEKTLNFSIQMPFEEVCHFLRRIDTYNEFEAENVLDALEYIDRLIPRKFYGHGNPNNGERRYTLSVGREGSPVLYLTLYEWGWTSEKPLDDHTLETIEQEMELTGKADEASSEVVSIPSGRKITFRFWWD